MKNYSRDKRSPTPTSDIISKIMSANKAKNTSPELLFRKALWENLIRGYRLHYKRIPGRPDIVFVSKKIAIFINGCYWHRCPHCDLPLPKSNRFFWKQKFDRNLERDKVKVESLLEKGWKPLIVWECKIKQDLKSEIRKVIELYE